ncbi:MAG: hypothetical protein V4539_15290 [Bacteroidota bacterium]
MKTTLTFLTILICSILATGCSKPDEVVPNDVRVARLLTGVGNKVWHLKKVYTNNVEQVLTGYQLSYTKTYTVSPGKQTSGTFTNSDNLFGTWAMSDAGNKIEESFVSGGGQGFILPYSINEITETTMDVMYSSNGKLTREVYYAY